MKTMGYSVRSWVIVLSMAVLASSASLDGDLCAKGESIWCQSLEAAEVCSAVDHCTETIWKNQKLEKDESNVCLFCQSVVSSSRQMSDAGKSQEKIDAFLLSATDLLPDNDKALQIKKKIERKSIPKILDSDIAPQVVCGLLDLCQGSKMELDLHMIESSPVEKTPEKFEWMDDIKLTTYCDDCKNFFVALKNLATGPTSALLTDIILDKVCSRTTTYKAQCENVAKNYLKDTINVLASFLVEAKVCQGIRLCKTSQTGLDGDFFEVDFGSVDWEDLVLVLAKLPQPGQLDGPQQPTTCPDCSNLFTAIKNLVQQQTPPFITDILLDQVCARLKKGQRECEVAVRAAVPTVIGFAGNFINPGQICKATKLCLKSEQTENDLNSIHWTKLIFPNETNMLLNQPTSCPDCTKFFTAIRKLVKDDASGFISDVMVDQICPLTGAFRKQCEDLTKNYLPVVIGLAASTLDPDKLCKSIGMCKKSENEIDLSLIDWDALVANQMLLNQPTSCPDCTKFFTAIRNLVKDTAPGFLSDIMVDQICPLTGTFRKQCEDVTKTYLPVAISLVASSLDPNKLCISIGMCKKSEDELIEDSDLFVIDLSLIDWETLIGNLGDSKCEGCKKGVQFVQSFIKSESVKRSIVLVVDKLVCAALGPFSLPCDKVVGTIMRSVLDLVARSLDPSKVCKIIRLCTTSDVFVDGDDVSNDDSVPVLEESEDLNVVECTACETVIGIVRAAIDTNMTKEDTLKSMHGLCALLPSGSAIAVRCNRFVSDHGQQVIESIVRKLQPKDICLKMELCQAFDFDLLDVVSVMGSERCIVCRSTVQYLEALMYQSDTVAMIQGHLKNLCHSLPPKVEQDVCLPFVTKYIPQLIYELSVLVPPKFFCTKIGICSD
jgi:hypothetical protein